MLHINKNKNYVNSLLNGFAINNNKIMIIILYWESYLICLDIILRFQLSILKKKDK